MQDFHKIQMPSLQASTGRTRSNTVDSGWSLSPQSQSPPNAKSPLSSTWKHGSPIITPTSSLSGSTPRQPPISSFTNPGQSVGYQVQIGSGSSGMSGSSTPVSSTAANPPSISIPVPTTFERPAAMASKGQNPPMPTLVERNSFKALHDSPLEMSTAKPLPDTTKS